MDQQISIPNHLGLILDGNRRWAKANGLTSTEGYQVGYKNLKDIAKYAFDKGINYVSAFVFSTENWSRTREEVKYLMSFALFVLTKDIVELDQNNIKVVWLGSREKLSKKMLKAIELAEARTINNTHGTLALCFNYGGHQEIVDAVKKIISDETPVEEVNPELIVNSLYKPELPLVDLVIRTSGENRLSGFMLYRAAYAEFYMTKNHWPDFKKADLDKALVEYSTRQRRFGK